MKDTRKRILRVYFDDEQKSIEVPLFCGFWNGLCLSWGRCGEIFSQVPYKGDLRHGSLIRFEY